MSAEEAPHETRCDCVFCRLERATDNLTENNFKTPIEKMLAVDMGMTFQMVFDVSRSGEEPQFDPATQFAMAQCFALVLHYCNTHLPDGWMIDLVQKSAPLIEELPAGGVGSDYAATH